MFETDPRAHEKHLKYLIGKHYNSLMDQRDDDKSRAIVVQMIALLNELKLEFIPEVKFPSFHCDYEG